MTFAKAFEEMAKVLPVEVVELMKGSFLVKKTDHEINKLYDSVFPGWKTAGQVNGLYLADKCNKSFSNVEDHLWHRACCVLNDWLYNMYCESIGAYDDEE